MLRIKHEIQQNTEEWMAFRSQYITASSFADFFMAESTVGFQKAIAKVALGRLGINTESFKGNWATEEGHAMEIVGKDIYSMATLETIEDGLFWTYGDWSGASPDGLIGIVNNSEVEGLWEHKAKVAPNTITQAFSEKYRKVGLTEKSNKKDFWQVHFQMYVTGAKWCDYQITAVGLKPMIQRINADKAIFTRIEQKLDEVIPMIETVMKDLKSQM